MISKEIKSASTVTLVTLDAAIPTNTKELHQLALDPDGWRLFSGNEAQNFLTKFKKVHGQPLEAVMSKKGDRLRLGGSVFTTLYTLLEYRPSIENAVSFVPLGTGNGLRGELDSLVDFANERREKLVSEMSSRFSGRLQIEETPGKGVTPLIVSLYQKGKRSMVLLRDEQDVVFREHSLSKPSLFLVDTRELVQKGYKKASLALAARPETTTVVGLGTEAILKGAIPDIKELREKTTGAFGFSGNKGEVEVLVKNWDGIDTIPELMKLAGVGFILETDGQKGASLYLQTESGVISGEYKIPKEEVYYGDTTNAGDVFLAATISGLMDLRENTYEKDLEMVLEGASQKTLMFLRSRT